MDKYWNLVDRAQLLMSQQRWDLAEQSLQSAIAEDPNQGTAYCLLSLIELVRERYTQAQDLAERGLGMSPDESFSHYVLSRVLFRRDQFKAARDAIDSAIALDPYDADFYGHKAAIDVSMVDWAAALEGAETGLGVDPDHVQCNNIRAIALTNMGRRDEAGATIESALRSNPEDPVSHANMGWTKLHAGEPDEAAEHFKEALRLDPENQWAQQGIVESLKAKNVVYRQILRYMLWVSRFSPRAQLLAFIGIIVLLQVMVRMPADSPMSSIGLLLACVYVLFVSSVWLASPLFDLLLRFNRYGRLVLTEEKRQDTVYMAIGLMVVTGLMAGPLITGFRTLDMVGYSFLLIALAVTLSVPRRAKRTLASAITVAVYGFAMVYWYRWYIDSGIEGLRGHANLVSFTSNWDPDAPKAKEVLQLVASQDTLQSLFMWPTIAMSWLADPLRRITK